MTARKSVATFREGFLDTEKFFDNVSTVKKINNKNWWVAQFGKKVSKKNYCSIHVCIKCWALFWRRENRKKLNSCRYICKQEQGVSKSFKRHVWTRCNLSHCHLRSAQKDLNSFTIVVCAIESRSYTISIFHFIFSLSFTHSSTRLFKALHVVNTPHDRLARSEDGSPSSTVSDSLTSRLSLLPLLRLHTPSYSRVRSCVASRVECKKKENIKENLGLVHWPLLQKSEFFGLPFLFSSLLDFFFFFHCFPLSLSYAAIPSHSDAWSRSERSPQCWLDEHRAALWVCV